MNRFLTTILLVLLSLGHLQYAEAKRTIPSSIDRNAKIIAKAADATGVSSDLLAGFSGAESGFDHRAKSDNSSATGICQFTATTWRTTLKTYGKQYGLAKNTRRTNAYANALMCGEYIKENKRYLKENLARKVTAGDLYLAHIISPQKVALLDHYKSTRSAASVMPEFAARNYNLFYHKSGKPKSIAAFRSGIYAKLKNNIADYAPLVKKHTAKPALVAAVVSKRPALTKATCTRPGAITTTVSESSTPVQYVVTIDPNGSPEKPKLTEKDDCYVDRRRMV